MKLFLARPVPINPWSYPKPKPAPKKEPEKGGVFTDLFKMFEEIKAKALQNSARKFGNGGGSQPNVPIP